mgnify:FL=1
MNKKGIHDLKNTVIYRNPTAISSDLDGESVILDMESGKYHSLDTTGTRVWELLEDKISFNDIVLKLMSEYSVEGQQCTTDVKEFINQLIDLGLVETDNS